VAPAAAALFTLFDDYFEGDANSQFAALHSQSIKRRKKKSQRRFQFNFL